MNKIYKTHPLLSLVNEFAVDSPLPSNINYIYNFGSLLTLVLVIQILTGIFLAMHYTPSLTSAFDSVEHIMRDVNSGWLIRYAHANGASFFFVCVYIHIGRGLYYGSYTQPRMWLWNVGIIIYFLMVGTAFLGYVLPWGQMSFWAATVITNMLSSIPYLGTDLVYFVWGGFSVSLAPFIYKWMKTLLNAGNTSLLELRYLLSKLFIFNKRLIKNNVKILNSRSQSAGVCKLICTSPSKCGFIRHFSSTASQRLHAKDLAWLVGFVEGDGWFSVNKNGHYCKYEFGIELSKKDIKLLYKIKTLLGVGSVHIRESNLNVTFKISSKIHLKNIILPIFDTYPMFTAKHWDYIYFRNNLLADVVLYNNLNPYLRPNHTPFTSIVDILSSPYFNNWLVGFIEAEGCFSIYKPANSSNNTVSFEIRQTNGLQIINAIKSCLAIKANPYIDKTNSVHLKTTSIEGIKKVIKFLSIAEAKLKGYKRLQYLLFLKELRVNDRYKTLSIPMRYGKN